MADNKKFEERIDGLKERVIGNLAESRFGKHLGKMTTYDMDPSGRVVEGSARPIFPGLAERTEATPLGPAESFVSPGAHPAEPLTKPNEHGVQFNKEGQGFLNEVPLFTGSTTPRPAPVVVSASGEAPSSLGLRPKSRYEAALDAADRGRITEPLPTAAPASAVGTPSSFEAPTAAPLPSESVGVVAPAQNVFESPPVNPLLEARPLPTTAPAPQPLIPNPTPQKTSEFEGSYQAADGSIVGLLRGGGKRVMTPEEVVSFDTANKAAGQPQITGGATPATPTPEGMQRTIDPTSGQVVFADPETASRFGQREREVQAADASALDTFRASPAARDMSNRFIQKAYSDQATIDAASDARVERANARPAFEDAYGGSPEDSWRTPQHFRDLAGERGKAKQIEATTREQEIKRDGSYAREDSLLHRKNSREDSLLHRKNSREDQLLGDKYQQQLDVIKAQEESRLRQIQLEGEVYGENLIKRKEMELKGYQERAALEHSYLMKKFEDAPQHIVDKYSAGLSTFDGQLAEATEAFKRATQVDPKALSDKEVEIRSNFPKSNDPESDEAMIQSQLNAWKKAYEESDPVKQAGRAASQALNKVYDARALYMKGWVSEFRTLPAQYRAGNPSATFGTQTDSQEPSYTDV